MSSDRSDLRDDLDRVDGNVNGLYQGVIPDLERRLEEMEKRQHEIETELESLREMIAELEEDE